MSNKEDSASKSNGLGVDPLQRLASFKAPRDLSLGSAKPNKKVFTPNLNVSRNKNKAPVPALNRDQKKDDKGKRDRKNDRNKNLKNGPNVIKSSGVFSEGLGRVERHTSRGSYGTRDTESAAVVLQKPTIRVKDVIRIDKESEERKIKAVMGELGTPGEEGVDFKTILERDAPVKLPMDDGGLSKQTKVKPAVVVKQEVVVKSDPDDPQTLAAGVQPQVAVKEEYCEDTDVVNLLRTSKPTLILLQLPDSLPGRGGSDEAAARRKPPDAAAAASGAEPPPPPQLPGRGGSDEAAARRKPPDAAAAASGAEPPPQPDPRCRLTDLEEGRIGTLQVHRSGRVTLKLGNTLFDVSPGTQPSFQQEVVHVEAAALTALGPLRHKLAVVPDWASLLPQCTA